MPLAVLVQCGLLFAAVLTAFAISTAVGILVAGLWATPRPLGDAPDEPGPRPSRSDPADDGAEALDLPPVGATGRVAEAFETVV
jgi:hypothetical protein